MDIAAAVVLHKHGSCAVTLHEELRDCVMEMQEPNSAAVPLVIAVDSHANTMRDALAISTARRPKHSDKAGNTPDQQQLICSGT